jgi:transcriptional regulator with XRE-family HTH domain
MLRVKARRLEKGWNQTQLGYYSGLTASEISKIETGRLVPYPRQVERLAGALDVEGESLLEEVEPLLPFDGSSDDDRRSS